MLDIDRIIILWHIAIRLYLKHLSGFDDEIRKKISFENFRLSLRKVLERVKIVRPTAV